MYSVALLFVCFRKQNFKNEKHDPFLIHVYKYSFLTTLLDPFTQLKCIPIGLCFLQKLTHSANLTDITSVFCDEIRLQMKVGNI